MRDLGKEIIELNEEIDNIEITMKRIYVRQNLLKSHMYFIEATTNRLEKEIECLSLKIEKLT